MLDSDLAEIYGYEKNFNRQVTINAVKFEGEDFMFKLTDDEWENLRCKNFTSSWGDSRYVPRVFTESVIYMGMKNDLSYAPDLIYTIRIWVQSDQVTTEATTEATTEKATEKATEAATTEAPTEAATETATEAATETTP